MDCIRRKQSGVFAFCNIKRNGASKSNAAVNAGIARLLQTSGISDADEIESFLVGEAAGGVGEAGGC